MKNLKRTLIITASFLIILLSLCFICSTLLHNRALQLRQHADALPQVAEFEKMIGKEEKIEELHTEIADFKSELEKNCVFFTLFIGNEHLTRVRNAQANLSAAIYSSERADYSAAREALLEAIDALIYVIG